MQTNILVYYTPSNPGVDPKGHFILKVVMLHVKSKRKSVEQHASKLFDILHTPALQFGLNGQKISIF